MCTSSPGRLVEILRPAGEPLLDLPLRGRQRLRQRRSGVPLALGELAPALFGDLPLLLDELRDRVGAGARQGVLELRGARLGLTVDDRPQLRLGVDEICVDRLGALERALQQHCRVDGDEAAGQAARRDRELALVRAAQREHDPGGERGTELEERQRAQRGPGKLPPLCADDGKRGDGDPRSEDDVEDGRQRHRPNGTGQSDRLRSSAAASRGMAAASSFSAISAAAPCPSPALRRARRTGVESVRCARLASVANAAAANASAPGSCSAEAKYAVRTGTPPTRANHRSEWNGAAEELAGCTRRRRRRRTR
jgi:hypothetical protein